MSIFVRSHRRNGRVVKAFTRGSTVRINKAGASMASFSQLRGVKMKVIGSSTVNFASGPQKYFKVSMKTRDWKGMSRKTADIPKRFLTNR